MKLHLRNLPKTHYGPVPYALLNKNEEECVNTIIRRSYKRALRLPPNTFTSLLQLDIHNTSPELPSVTAIPMALPHQGWPSLTKAPHSLKNLFKSDPYCVICTLNTTVNDVRLVWRPSHGSTVQMLMQSPQTQRHAPPKEYLLSLPLSKHTHQLELKRRQLHLPSPLARLTVVADSQKACRHFQAGMVHAAARAMHLRHPPQRQMQIVWTPAHLGVRGNETAHDLAREMTHRTRGEDASSE